MDDNDFMKAFMGVDMLAVEGVGRIVGVAVSKLHAGMLEGGMNEFAANAMIASIFRVVMQEMVALGKEQFEAGSDGS